MKLFKLLPIFGLLLFSSCDEQKKETDDLDDMAEQTDSRAPAEANKQWIDAWNRNNPQELDTLTSKDAVLYMQGQSMSADSIRSWYNNAAPVMKELTTTPEVEYSGSEIAYEAGTYMYGVKNDSTNTSYEGSYTLIWKKMNKDWKLQVMNISDKEQDTTATD